ncbi:hypothetical protein VNI00_006955 [Paramarasmius palmivorus]|uniref:Uncharacterized protein n=1 Tax=Paramarasmius palmivorus TaxID=297713 RepID=A0AAW0D5A8_9AGAR
MGSTSPTRNISQKARRDMSEGSSRNSVIRRASGVARNITVDDSDTSISYKPNDFWLDHLAAQACSECLHPDASLALGQTFHLAMHNVSFDADDIPPTSSMSTASSTSSQPSQPTQTSTSEVDDVDDDDDDHGGGRDRGHGGRSLGIERRLDADDPGFVDEVINVEFKFTGTAVYLYAILPLLPTTSPFSTPTTTNVSFTLDNQSYGNYTSEPTAGSSEAFSGSVPVLALGNLTEEPHVLLVTVAPDSVFIFDYMVYTTTQDDEKPLPAQADQESETSTRTRNVATFGGAIGGSVGVLSIIALGIFISLYRRRLKAAKRDRLLANSESDNNLEDNDAPGTIYTNHGRSRRLGRIGQAQEFNNLDHGLEEDYDGSADNSPSRTPQMSMTPGARPFVPRYFPGSNGLPVHPPTTGQPGVALSPQTTRDYPPPYADGAQPAFGEDGVLLVPPPPLYGMSVRGEDGSIPIVIVEGSQGRSPYLTQPQSEQPPPSFGESQSETESERRSPYSHSIRSTISTSTLPSVPHDTLHEIEHPMPSQNQPPPSLPSTESPRLPPPDAPHSDSSGPGRPEGAE